jgi:hypothetical protein
MATTSNTTDSNSQERPRKNGSLLPDLRPTWRRPDIPWSGTPPAKSDTASSFELSKDMSPHILPVLGAMVTRYYFIFLFLGGILPNLVVLGTAGRAVFQQLPLCQW